MTELDDDELLDALGVEVAPTQGAHHTPREERIIAGFEDILRFRQTHGRAPQHGEGRDIFERLYAVRLDRMRGLPEATALLADRDVPGLLRIEAPNAVREADILDEDALLAELGVGAPTAAQGDITVLRHVRSHAQKKAAQDIANRKPCEDFDRFEPLFVRAESGLEDGTWMTKPFVRNASIQVGDFFIIGGQTAYVAQMYAAGKTKDGRDNPRLRVIFNNHTESDLLLRSLSRSLYPDGDTPVGRRLIPKDNGPLFADVAEPDDIESGTVYVLRSLSSDPFVAQHRELIHKIGVTGADVKVRIANAKKDATYLLADVEVVATYKLHNISRKKLEKIFHRLFANVQIDLTIKDRFGNPVKPREWFLVPFFVIDEAVRYISNGDVDGLAYDASTARLIRS